ncbi:MAG: carbamoyl-phosphate synthase large subunit [Enterobacterales bacterium]
MPKRNDIKIILILGAGPIVIGQACEFDYSGVQACKALKEEGYKIVLVNSNPATIMTDPDMSDITYIEPLHWKVVTKIIEKERPDALLPTMGGQTALNCALDLENHGILNNFNVEMIGVTANTIIKAENRRNFNNLMKNINLETARYGIAHSIEESLSIVKNIGFPCIIRPSFTMGGSGGGIAYNYAEFNEICQRGLDISPINELIIDESLIGWKEYEMEAIRDKKDNCIIVCSIENIDPMGIHTGDSITVAPAQTLTDKEYQIMRNASIKILRAVDVQNGGSNVQFAIHPTTGRMVVIEMNPRVSRSSALASKATGFPIAKISAKLSIGYTLDELMNNAINRNISASFEPSIDYVVTKIPRFNFEKFSGINDRLTTEMKSVGEVMAIGRTQQESLQKAICSLEIDSYGFESKVNIYDKKGILTIRKELKHAGSNRIWYIADAFRYGMSLNTIFKLTNIDPWFLSQIEELINIENKVIKIGVNYLTYDNLFNLKQKGFSDIRISQLVNKSASEISKLRIKYSIHPVYKRVDTCAAEFDTETAYMYSTYEEECESNPNKKNKKIIILGSGPNRIGQGIEFDYCCVHAALALRKDGYEVIIINCNPETVSTDYDISDRLYFEPLTLEYILEIIRIEKPDGVIIQFGGQTPLKLAKELEHAGVPILGTSPKNIDRTEDRKKFQLITKALNLKQSSNTTVHTLNVAIKKAKLIGYPIIIRPSYVLGGRAMEIVYNKQDLIEYFNQNIISSNKYPILIDKFLDGAIEIDMDVICDGTDVFIGGIMEHIEQAGIHSGDSACSLPTYTVNSNLQKLMKTQAKKIAFELNIIGLMNIQFAIKDSNIYLLEVNPRAARTVPFVSKSTGIALAKVAARVMVGISLYKQGILKEIIPPYFSVKEVVLPFNKFPNVDPILGPEMRSTGEVMGVGRTFSEAFSKALLSSNVDMKKTGRVLISVRDKDKHGIIKIAHKLIKYGFKLYATYGTYNILKKSGIYSKIIHKMHEGFSHIHEKIKNGYYVYIVNTVTGKKAIEDSKLIRNSALKYRVHYDTTLNGSIATVMSLSSNATENIISLQEMHKKIKKLNKNLYE